LDTKPVNATADGKTIQRNRRLPGPRPSAELAERRRKEILDAAAELFFKKGFAATSMDDVAASLGHTKGVIYHYFHSKNDLLLGIFIDVQEESGLAFRAIMQSSCSASESIERLIAFLADKMVHAKWRYAFLYSYEVEQALSAEQAQLVMQKARDNIAPVVAIISAGMSNGEFVRADAVIVARLVLGAVLEIGRWYDPAGRVPFDELRNSISRLIFCGIKQA
jgi:AcrR family transcriptional regulator